MDAALADWPRRAFGERARPVRLESVASLPIATALLRSALFCCSCLCHAALRAFRRKQLRGNK